jgi:hypothetical protein
MRTNPVWVALLVFLLTPGLAHSGFAGEFEGLQPGVSRKADADRALGAPVREMLENVVKEAMEPDKP